MGSPGPSYYFPPMMSMNARTPRPRRESSPLSIGVTRAGGRLGGIQVASRAVASWDYPDIVGEPESVGKPLSLFQS